MWHLLLSIIFLWSLSANAQATVETCMGLNYCTDCQNYTLECSSCSPGYILNSDNTGCVDCGIDNCNTCESTGNDTFRCTTCNSGYYLVNDTSCAACDNGCKTCTDSSTCTECDVGFYLDSSACRACSVDNCVTCNSSACYVCDPGYYLVNITTCEACTTTNCMTCEENSCTACLGGYYLDSSGCTACPANCQVCDTSGVCTKCNDKFYLDDSNTCQSTSMFGSECLDVAVPPPSCTTCQSGVAVTLIDGKCVKNCTLCGSYTGTIPTSPASDCNNADGVYTNVTYCEYGCATMVGYVNGVVVSIARGCSNDFCSSENAEQCTNIGLNQTCVTCCSATALCNSDYYNPSSSAPTNHYIILSVMLVAMVADCLII